MGDGFNTWFWKALAQTGLGTRITRSHPEYVRLQQQVAARAGAVGGTRTREELWLTQFISYIGQGRSFEASDVGKNLGLEEVDSIRGNKLIHIPSPQTRGNVRAIFGLLDTDRPWVFYGALTPEEVATYEKTTALVREAGLPYFCIQEELLSRLLGAGHPDVSKFLVPGGVWSEHTTLPTGDLMTRTRDVALPLFESHVFYASLFAQHITPTLDYAFAHKVGEALTAGGPLTPVGREALEDARKQHARYPFVDRCDPNCHVDLTILSHDAAWQDPVRRKRGIIVTDFETLAQRVDRVHNRVDMLDKRSRALDPEVRQEAEALYEKAFPAQPGEDPALFALARRIRNVYRDGHRYPPVRIGLCDSVQELFGERIDGSPGEMRRVWNTYARDIIRRVVR